MLIYGAQQQSWDVNEIFRWIYGIFRDNWWINGVWLEILMALIIDWLLVLENMKLFCFPYIGNVIIPSDETHIFSEELKTTNQIWMSLKWMETTDWNPITFLCSSQGPPQMKRPAVPRPTHRNWFSGVILTMLPQFVKRFSVCFIIPIFTMVYGRWISILYGGWPPVELFHAKLTLS